ncbi:MAG TPA: 2,3-bisphosphoglycerate-independent phosphoglycerate mutase [Thermoleophilaceae bacterium]|nr:2,3-bisphosphoglycerate-independent phosphoglycerate mutase [Thermoleophilaceae bacterium]
MSEDLSGLLAGPAAPPVPAVCLIVLDGWGLAPAGPGNAISLARTPVFDGLWQSCARAELIASGTAVGLPEGQIGNSEVGHMNLGAGAVVKQYLTRIDDAIVDASFADNEALRAACARGREAGRLHLLGLVSSGGVHSSFEHLLALIDLAAAEGVPDVVLHAFTDGRDTAPDSGLSCVELAERRLVDLGIGRVGTVAGRFYAMDRDRRRERTHAAYDVIVHGHAEGRWAPSGTEAVAAAYERGETDEFVLPTTVGEAEAHVRPGDPVICFNFRPDRARQLMAALGEPGFAEFDRGGAPEMDLTTLTQYSEDWTYPVAFPPSRLDTSLAAIFAERGVRQLHVAETEKYPHVTYFFNGGEEKPYEGEDRCLVDSPRDVATYDQKPEMSARELTDAFLERWRSGEYRFCIINFANPDMVGHTGVIPAAVTAVETVDECLGRVVEAVHAGGGACIVTADHGNADEMLLPDGSPQTAHSLSPVPIIVTADVGALPGGVLADIAPTVLSLLEVGRPQPMSGRALVPEKT